MKTSNQIQMAIRQRIGFLESRMDDTASTRQIELEGLLDWINNSREFSRDFKDEPFQWWGNMR